VSVSRVSVALASIAVRWSTPPRMAFVTGASALMSGVIEIGFF